MTGMEAAAATSAPAASARGAAGLLAAALAGAVMGFAGLPREAWAGPNHTVTVTAGGLWPLAALAHELGLRHGLAVTYEDLPIPQPGDVLPERHPTPEAGTRHVAWEPEPLVLRYEVDASGLMIDPEALLGAAIAAQNQVDPRGSFRLEAHDGIFHLVPATVRRADGSSRPVHSLLDVEIDLPRQERTLQGTLDAVLAAVGRAHGVRIHYMGWGIMQQRCRLGFLRVPAHLALERILAQQGVTGLVWHLRAFSDPEVPDDYLVYLPRIDLHLGLANSIFEPDSDPPEWAALGPGDKPWRRLGMEQAAALIGSPAEGNRIAGYDAIVERQGSANPIPAGERAALVAALLPLAAAPGDSDSWYGTRVLASLALGSLHEAAAAPLLLDRLQDDFPRLTFGSDLRLPPAAIALALAGPPAIPPILARAGTAGDDEWQLLLGTLRLMDSYARDWRIDGAGPTAAQVASSMLDHCAGGRARDRLLALVSR